MNQRRRTSEALGITLNLSLLMEKRKIRLSELEKSFIRSINAGKINSEELKFLKRVSARHV